MHVQNISQFSYRLYIKMILILVSMERGDSKLCTSSKYKGIGRLLNKIMKGIASAPSEDVLQEMPQEDEG